MAESIGLSPEAVHPDDELADFWRMQWFGRDALDVTFRLEKILNLKIPRVLLDRFERHGRFDDFASAAVEGLNSLPSSDAKPLANPNCES